MGVKLTDKQRKDIIRYRKQKKSCGWIAKKVGCSADSVSRIAKKAGIPSDVSHVKKANDASVSYGLERRLAILGRGLDKGDELLKKTTTNSEYQKWTVGVATLIDKVRLEMGEVTGRSESHTHSYEQPDLESYFEQLDAFTRDNSEEDLGERLHSSETNGASA